MENLEVRKLNLLNKYILIDVPQTLKSNNQTYENQGSVLIAIFILYY